MYINLFYVYNFIALEVSARSKNYSRWGGSRDVDGYGVGVWHGCFEGSEEKF